MKIRAVVSSMVVLASMMAGEAAYAAPTAIHMPVQALYGKAKTVSFSVRNDSTSTVKVKAGLTELTIEPGKTAAVKLAVGESIVTQDATAKYAAGAVLVTASAEMSNSTVVLN